MCMCVCVCVCVCGYVSMCMHVSSLVCCIDVYRNCLCSYHHHHHHVVPLARISLTLSRHFSLSFIASGRSLGLHPVSSHSCWMYVRAGRPAFARSYVGGAVNFMCMYLYISFWYILPFLAFISFFFFFFFFISVWFKPCCKSISFYSDPSVCLSRSAQISQHVYCVLIRVYLM